MVVESGGGGSRAVVGKQRGAGRSPSPFPGMDPYLEGYLWPEVLTALATTMRQRLVPLVRPRYTVRIGVYVAHDLTPEAEIGIMYPDVEILRGGVARVEPRRHVRARVNRQRCVGAADDPWSLNPSRSH